MKNKLHSDDYKFINYDLNFINKRINILENVVDYEKMINYGNLFFITGNSSNENFDFLKRFGTLYNLLIDLLNKKSKH